MSKVRHIDVSVLIMLEHDSPVPETVQPGSTSRKGSAPKEAAACGECFDIAPARQPHPLIEISISIFLKICNTIFVPRSS